MKQTQVHEAGHLLIARQYGFKVHDAWAEDTEYGNGEVTAEMLLDHKYSAPIEVVVLDFASAGVASEIAYYGKTTLRESSAYRVSNDMEIGEFSSIYDLIAHAQRLAAHMSPESIEACAKDVRIVRKEYSYGSQRIPETHL